MNLMVIWIRLRVIVNKLLKVIFMEIFIEMLTHFQLHDALLKSKYSRGTYKKISSPSKQILRVASHVMTSTSILKKFEFVGIQIMRQEVQWVSPYLVEQAGYCSQGLSEEMFLVVALQWGNQDWRLSHILAYAAIQFSRMCTFHCGAYNNSNAGSNQTSFKSTSAHSNTEKYTQSASCDLTSLSSNAWLNFLVML